MRSSSIYIKFGSEAQFERLTFPSHVVSYDEIKKYLEKKKKIVFADKKTDKITLIDVNRNAEIVDGFIEANTRVIVQRTPLVKSEAIELTYNPKQNIEGGTRDKGQLEVDIIGEDSKAQDQDLDKKQE